MSLKRESNNHRYNNHNHRDKQELEELSDARIITKNLVYIIGLSASIANKEKLNKYEYLGQYGTIIKIVVNKNKAYNQNNPHGPSYSAYVTFSKPCEASIAILSLDDKMIDNHVIRASFGTTKYCSFFLKGIECTNKECLFLHKWAEETDIIKRGDLISNKVIFTQQHNYAKKIADIYNPEVKKKILSAKKGKTIFPSPDIIYRTISVMEKEKNNSKNKKNSTGKNDINRNKIISPVKENKNKDINEKGGNKKIADPKYVKVLKSVFLALVLGFSLQQAGKYITDEYIEVNGYRLTKNNCMSLYNPSENDFVILTRLNPNTGYGTDAIDNKIVDLSKYYEGYNDVDLFDMVKNGEVRSEKLGLNKYRVSADDLSIMAKVNYIRQNQKENVPVNPRK